MRTFGIIMLCILAVISGGVAWYMLAYPTYTYRYRMTVNVMVGGVVHTGSSVIEVRLSRQPRILPDVLLVVPHVAGNAVFVDLGGGRNVIALLASGPNGFNVNYPYQVVPQLFRVAYDDRDLPTLPNLRGRREISAQYLPTFVTFANLNDPKSARLVTADEFAKILGPDVRFIGAWIEMTSDTVTQGIETALPWWKRPGRPASEAYRAWLRGETAGPAIEPETLFKRG